jgi:hypothetical protein
MNKELLARANALGNLFRRQMPPKKAPAPATAPETEEPLSPELQQLAYTCPEILKILDIHYDTLQRWRKRGIAPPRTLLPGRKVIFFKDSFVQWMRDREQKPKPCASAAPRPRRQASRNAINKDL